MLQQATFPGPPLVIPKFPHVPLGIGGWPLGHEERSVGLIFRAISFQDFQPMRSWSTNATDRRTDDMQSQYSALHWRTLHVHSLEIAALFCAKWRHGRQLESKTSYRKSDSDDRSMRIYFQISSRYRSDLKRRSLRLFWTASPQQEQQQQHGKRENVFTPIMSEAHIM